MVDPLPNYFAMLSGLTKATRARARAAAQAIVSQAGLDDVAADATELITKLTEEITGASRANRELLENLVATEVDKAAGRLGFARSQELAALRLELTTLGARVAVIESRVIKPAPVQTTPTKAPAKKTTATKTAAKKTPASKTAATKTAATKTAASKAAASKGAAKKTPAKKAPAKKTAAETAPTEADS